MNTNQIVTEPETSNVVGVQFSIMSPDEIKRSSVVEIETHETYDKNVPVVKGLFDIRLGTTEMDTMCGTCNQNNMKCPGHFGHINLAKPVFHYQYVSMIQKILKCTCIQCSKLLINKDSDIIQNLYHLNNKVRWEKIYEISSKIKRCGQETDDGCGAKQPDKLKLDEMNGILATWSKLKTNDEDSKKQVLTVENIKSIFERMSDEDVELLGFSKSWCRPEWLICSVFPVPPPSVRPSVKIDDSQRQDDDITHKLCDIIKVNNVLKNKLANNSKIEIINDWTKILQYHIATLVDNELPGIAPAVHRSGRPLKAIRQRLKGKEGRIRNNLMGKRVDYSGRSVITPDPNIELDELGVPIKIASNLTYPEIVNQYNIEKLKEILSNDINSYPSITLINKKNNRSIKLTSTNKSDIELEYGDIVHRHLLDGDFVLFNRQPSLHKMSMMGHRVRVMKGDTFRLNVSVTPPYNADFDGDEMNVHAPQSIPAVCELMNIASVKYQILSPRSNKPIITIVQDTLLGINKLTKGEIINYTPTSVGRNYFSNNTSIHPIKGNKDVSSDIVDSSYFSRSQIMNLLCTLSTYNGIIPEPSMYIDFNNEKIPMWSGKSVISYIIPDIINLTHYNESYDGQPIDELNKIVIKNGTLVSGGLDKGVFTATSKGLIHVIYNDLGPERTKDFIDDLQKIVTYFLLLEGFSVGIGDMMTDNEINQKIDAVINDNNQKIETIMQEIHLDIFENMTGQTNQEYFEMKMNSLLNNTLKITGKIGLENLDQKNRLTNMINCGSKGSSTNVAQIVACLGQQNVDGKRIPSGYTDRTLPHYYKYDDSAEARGFVKNSFITGQTPQEYFFHAMAGREGLIDTAVKTSATGYIQRKLMKSMEDLKVDHDYSVRDSSRSIIQFTYGGDSMDSCAVESQPLLIMKMKTEEIIEMFLFKKGYTWSKVLTKETIKQLKKVKKFQSKFQEKLLQLLDHKDYIFNNFCKKDDIITSFNYPVHISRIINNVCSTTNELSDISPLEIFEKNDILKKKLDPESPFSKNDMINILIDIYLHPKRLIEMYKIQSKEYLLIIEKVENVFIRSKINPGEMVGAVAAQSIGEPATQMTLNTFHFAGVSAKSNVTRGIPRLNELLSVTQNLKSPSTKIYLKTQYGEHQNKSQYVKNILEYTVLKDIITQSQIYYDPKNTIYETGINEDQGMLSIYKEFLEMENGSDYDYEETSPWIIRFTFNKEYMMENGIVMEDVNSALMDYDNMKMVFIYSDDNSKELIGRISIKANIIGKEDEMINGLYDQTDVISKFKNIEVDILNNVIIKGVKDITNIVMSEHIIYEKIDHEIEKKEVWILETDGVNLLDICNSQYVDYMYTYSNDVVEIYKTLGIEAARELLIEEISDVIDTYVNKRHIELLCDIMTNRGELSAINRQGINRGDIGPLAKCSFEDTTDQLIKASLFGERDELEGVSSNIMMGQIINAGTGMSEIYMDEEKLIELLQDIDYTADDFATVSEKNVETLLETESEDEDCLDTDFDFSM
jgi:DNA-directed RNA polymerase II subunit RPB1